MQKVMIRYNVLVNGKYARKFERKKDSFMNRTWEQFNNYAKGRGFTNEVVDSKYLGNLAWANQKGEIMELVRA